jgi:hypothetical protein
MTEMTSMTMTSMTMPTRTLGTKGANVWSGTGSALVDYSVGAVRGASAESINKILTVCEEEGVATALVMAFHVRNIRGGKGERQVFKDTLRALYNKYPELILDLLDLVPRFGCWDDLFRMAGEMDDAFMTRVVSIAAGQLREDVVLADVVLAKENLSNISLCAKWAPRERSGKRSETSQKHRNEKRVLDALSYALHPNLYSKPGRMAAYRSCVSKLNKHIKTVETQMCSGHWADINPASVPGRAGKNYSSAFLNLPLGPIHGLRKPDDADRMSCREHFLAHNAAAANGLATVHGADTLFPHEVVKKVYELLEKDGSQEELNPLIAIWNSMVASVKAAGNGLADCEVMCDFSGSMRNAGMAKDTPFWVSMALGIMISEINGSNRIMSFASEPEWHTFPSGTIVDKIISLTVPMNGHGFGQGLSTNFQAAYGLLVDDVKLSRKLPKFLLVLTDMNFDVASDSRGGSKAKTQTHAEMGRETFRRLGEDICGIPEAFPAPLLGIWNLAANPTDFQATANEEGVIMLSGWSAAQFKILQKEGLRATTSLEMLRQELDVLQYVIVRQRVDDFLDDQERQRVREFFRDREARGYAPGYEGIYGED